MNPLVMTGLGSHDGATALSVNLNLVAMMRNRRELGIPSVTLAATRVLEAGAAGITVHPRPDARHIRAADVRDLAELLADWPAAEFNIEGNPFHNLMNFVRERRPQQCTFVPDSEGQSTSDHGWDLARDGARLAPLIDEARALGVRVSLFMDADPQAMAAARALGADRVELYTEPYAAAGAATCAVRRRGARGAGRGPGRERRARPESRQPRRFPVCGAGSSGSLDRPCLHLRCARTRLCRDGARLSACDPGRAAAMSHAPGLACST